MKKIILLTTFLLINTFLNAQRTERTSVTGKVVDAGTKTPLEFANVVLMSFDDSTNFKGAATDAEGIFKIFGIKEGKYFLKISYIGYQNKIIKDLTIKRNNRIDLEEILLEQQTFKTGDVVVSENRAPISYEIDKKVIKVSEQITALSGNALDVLENVPSVTVDIEGNVTLRGSSNFRVLIDGRPTILEGSELLEQTPASSIENIEIITNPSVKYDPEGTAGIINLIMKKNQNLGFSGLTELNIGLRDKYGVQLFGDYKTEKLTFTLGLDYNKNNYYGNFEQINETTFNNITTTIEKNGDMSRKRDYWGIRGELGFQLSENDYLMFGVRFRDRSFGRVSDENFFQWNNVSPDKNNFLSTTDRNRSGNNYSFYSNYDHKFNTKGHLIKAEFQFEKGDGDEITTNESLDKNSILFYGRKSTESGPDTEIETKIDYTLPFSKSTKFEAGYQNEIENSNEVTGIADYNLSTKKYNVLTEFNKDVLYKVNQHALYSLFSSEWNDLGYQFGLRTEYTDREIELSKTNQQFIIDQIDYFPSLHFSYKLGGGNELMTSYTRRIDRPRGWELEPFETWMDAYNVRIGNPALKPEYIDSYELGYQTLISDIVFSFEGYYRVTHNKIERLRSVYAENITLSSTDNVGKDYSFGTELMFNLDPIKNWNVNLMGNLYNYKVEGEIFNKAFSRESFNWNVRFNNSYKLFASTRLQFNLMYNSPTVSSQGERKGFLFSNFAVKQELFNRALSVTLQVRDLFGTGEYKFTSRAENYYNYSHYTRESPMVMLNLKYLFNKKPEKSRNGRNGNGDMGDSDGF